MIVGVFAFVLAVVCVNASVVVFATMMLSALVFGIKRVGVFVVVLVFVCVCLFGDRVCGCVCVCLCLSL